MAGLVLAGVCKQFPDGTTAIKNVSLKVEDREFLVLVGPSGSGKSTTLRMIAGLDHPTAGCIKIGDEVVGDKPPKDRNIAMVFQNYALYPHMTVYRNLSFGLLLRYGGGVLNRGLIRIFRPWKSAEFKRLRSGIDHQVRQAADRLGISHLLGRRPHQLSGGERQRVALGRAIVREPAVFLFDEPLSNLDAKLRQQMRVELKRLHRELDATIVYVTHDQVEAMTMGDRIAVMKDGEILQTGAPSDLYHRPANTFVAQFIGSVPTNLIPQTAITTKLEKDGRQDLLIGFRAEHARMKKVSNSGDKLIGGAYQSENEHDQLFQFPATIQAIDRLGDSTLVNLVVDSAGTTAVDAKSKEIIENTETAETETNPTTPIQKRKSSTEELPEIDQTLEVTVRISDDTDYRLGQRVIVEVDRNRLMWFDLSSGHNLDRENS